MSRKFACSVVVFSLLMMWSVVAAVAGEEEVPKVIFVQNTYVHPEHIGEYEASVAELKKAAAAHDMAYEWDLYRTDDVRYLAVWLVDGMAGIDNLYAEWEAFGERWGKDAFAEWNKRVWATIEHMESSIWRPRPDLSYTPENESDEFKYIVWGFVPIKPGHELAVAELFKEYAKVYTEHEIPHAWSTAEGDIGVEYPILTFIEWSASAGSYWGRHDEAVKNEPFSKKTNALWAKMLPHIRGFEWSTGTYLEELSYHPEKKAEAAEEK